MKYISEIKKKLKKVLIAGFLGAASLGLAGCGFFGDSAFVEETGYTGEVPGYASYIGGISETDTYSGEISESGTYTGKEEVAGYIHEYSHLPDNYITKTQAKNLGWDSNVNYLSDVAPGKSIGGDRYMNYSGYLPDESGRKYYECDIDYTGGSRNAKRLVYSNDGLIYYTEDHYNTFEELY